MNPVIPTKEISNSESFSPPKCKQKLHRNRELTQLAVTINDSFRNLPFVVIKIALYDGEAEGSQPIG